MSSKKKGLLLILDGLGDRGIASFDGMTPLERANTPNMDQLIAAGQGALVDPLFPGVPVGTHTGSAVLLGMPPRVAAVLPRGPVEAAGIGIPFTPGDILIRCNFATLEACGDKLRIVDRRAGRIHEKTDELAQLLYETDLGEGITATLYPATQHRAVLKLSGEGLSAAITDTDPGSRLLGQEVLPALPLEEDEAAQRTAGALNRFTSLAYEKLKQHPVNLTRSRAGLPVANGIICRSAGQYQHISSLVNHLGLKTGLVAGERTLIGLGNLLGYQVHRNPRFTSLPNTDVKAKIETALAALEESDLVIVHIKGPDICAHDYDPEAKRRLLEVIDTELAPLIGSDLVVAITGDHSTDCNSGRHTGDSVPSLLYVPNGRRDHCLQFGETNCANGGLGRVSGTGFICSMLDGMNRMGNLKPVDIAYYAPAVSC